MESYFCSSPKKALSATFHFHPRPILQEIKTWRNFQTPSSSPTRRKKTLSNLGGHRRRRGRGGRDHSVLRVGGKACCSTRVDGGLRFLCHDPIKSQRRRREAVGQVAQAGRRQQIQDISSTAQGRERGKGVACRFPLTPGATWEGTG